ncbi:helix-turn-helix transcriptional regulator [Haladaptatus sp. ZSTT2]|uniref:helix-turn-helix transcriptional regulator n=1 Tax=Haladaptatus sp. ZSTT2 TaxID=3120515 RepID=UPI00300F48BD
MNRLSAVCLVFLLVLTATAPAVAYTPDSPGGSTDSVAAAQDFDRTEFTIEVYENGSARWTFAYKLTLETDEDRQQFDQYAAEFNQNETELYTQFQNQSKALAASGEQATGRSMSASGFSKRASVNELGNQGIVEMQFTWSNFAAPEGGQLVVGDVFEGGLYIGPNQSLTIKHDGPLQFTDTNPEPDAISGENLSSSDSVTWFGERQFADQQPRIVLGEPGSGSGGSSTTDGGPAEGGGLPIVPLAAVVFLLALAAGAFAYRSGALPTLGRDDDDDGTGATATQSTSTAASATTGVTDEELLTDENRVLRLLEESGGRMRQVNIVDETGWSKSKVSMLLSDMEDDGTISKLRMGRENIVSLSGHEPEATQSSLDDK